MSESPNQRLLGESAWQLDSSRSDIGFRAPHFFGLKTVTGQFRRYEGSLDLRAKPAIQLTIEAGSLDTGNKKRDRHLRSPDFFDVARHPQIVFISDEVTVEGDVLLVRGHLHAAGRTIALAIDATLRQVDGELELRATTDADQRALGMSWSPLGMLRTPSTLTGHGRLVRDPGVPREG